MSGVGGVVCGGGGGCEWRGVCGVQGGGEWCVMLCAGRGGDVSGVILWSGGGGAVGGAKHKDLSLWGGGPQGRGAGEGERRGAGCVAEQGGWTFGAIDQVHVSKGQGTHHSY